MADEEGVQTRAFTLFRSMKRYFELNAQTEEQRANANAILQHSRSIKTEMWTELLRLLKPLMASNKISMPKELAEPESDQDFDFLEFLLKYVYTDPEQRRSLPMPLARPIAQTWKEWFMEKGITWISARGSTSGKFATGLIELFAAVVVANYLSGAWNCSLGKDKDKNEDKSDNTKPEDKGKEAESNDDLDFGNCLFVCL